MAITNILYKESFDMRLFIAEKPSVAKAIADELGVTGKGDGYIQCGIDKITWCFGHMLELAEPDDYTPDDIPRHPKTGKKYWRVEDLPIIPNQWIVRPKEDAKKQLKIIGQLLKEAQVIVNAGDSDREGQLLIDEVLTHFNNQKSVLRFWVAAHDSISLKRGLHAMRDNEEFKGLGCAAIARSRADWLIGMNLSRAYTLKANRGGSQALLTVGRVQTPTLTLVVNRDKEIETFLSKSFHTIKAVIQHNQDAFLAKWVAQELQEGLDEEGRLLNTEIANALIEKMTGSLGVVKEYKQEPRQRTQPRAYSLSDITLIASNKFGYSAIEVLEICQALYETHKLTSYPRTDCAYLPESQFADAPLVLDAIKHVNPELAPLIDKADPAIKSKTWDDSKVTVHFGIIPTMHKGSKINLNEKEHRIYELIVRSYIAQFYPVQSFLSTKIEMEVADELFTASGKTIVTNGWCDVYSEERDDVEEDIADNQILPVMNHNDSISCVKASRIDAKTKPPTRYTEGTLQRAMENIHKTITNVEHKKILREGDGIGTPATRASIISELKRRTYIEAKGKYIVSTVLGRSVIASLPDIVKSPVLTALYERVLRDIEKQPTALDAFVTKQSEFVIEQVAIANQGSLTIAGAKKEVEISSTYYCALCKKGLCRRKSAKGFWWSCSGFPECKQTYPDFKGQANYKTKE